MSLSEPVDLVSTVNVTALVNEQTIDGVLTNASRVLLTAQSNSPDNGPWVTSSGSWSRPTDFSADAQVIPGDLTYVNSGTLGSGSNWQLISGSTFSGAKVYQRVQAGGLAHVFAPDYLRVNAATQYGVQAGSSITAAASFSKFFDAAINQACWDAHNRYLTNKIQQVVQLPMGLIQTQFPILMFEGVTLSGAGPVASMFLPQYTFGGPTVWCSNSPQIPIYTPVNGVTAVDTDGNALALQMWDTRTFAGQSIGDPFFDLTLAGLWIAPQVANKDFHVAQTFLMSDMTIGGYLFSCRGRMETSLPMRECCSLYVDTSGFVRLALRVTYGAKMFVAAGSGSAPTLNTRPMTGSPTLTFSSNTIVRSGGAWTADGFLAGDTVLVTGTASNNFQFGVVSVVTPSTLTFAGATFITETSASASVVAGVIPEGRIVTIEPDSIGNTALAATTFRLRVNDGAWKLFHAAPDGSGRLPATGPFPNGDVLAGVQFTMPSQTYHGPVVAEAKPTDYFENTTQVSIQTSTSPNKVTANDRFSAEFTFVSATGAVNLYVNKSSNSPTFQVTASTTVPSGGHVQQLPTETCVVGSGTNSAFPCGTEADGRTPHFFFGGIRFATTLSALMGTSTTSVFIVPNLHIQMFFVPLSINNFDGPDGVRYGYIAQIDGATPTLVMGQYAGGATGFVGSVGLENLGCYLARPKQAGFALVSGLTLSRFRNIYCQGGRAGLTLQGLCFLNVWGGELTVGTSSPNGYDFAIANGGIESVGTIKSLGAGGLVAARGASFLCPYMFLNPNGASAPFIFTSTADQGSLISELIVDGENVNSCVTPMVSISVLTGDIAEFSGNMNGQNDRTCLSYSTENGAVTGKLRWNVATAVAVAGSDYAIEMRDRVVAMTGAPTLTFADSGTGSGDSCTRSPGSGSWFNDGFFPGRRVRITGTSSNDGIYTIVALSPTVLSVGIGAFFTAEVTSGATVIQIEETKPIELGPRATFPALPASAKIASRPGFIWPRDGAKPAFQLPRRSFTYQPDRNEQYNVIELPAGALGADVIYTLGGTGTINEGQKIRVRIGAQTGGHAVTIANGGPSGGTLATITSGTAFTADFQSPDGANYAAY